VLPLDDRFVECADVSLRPNPLAGRKPLVYLPGTVRVSEPTAPNTRNVDHTIAVELTIPPSGTAGTLVSMGGESAGYTLFIHDGKLVWEHNSTISATVPPRIKPSQPAITCYPPISASTTRKGPERAAPSPCATGRPSSARATSPATFTGTIDKVIIDISGESFDDVVMRERVALGMQ